MHNRLFVLKPLFEISGEITIPGLGSLGELIDRAPALKINLVKH
jgi:7,8-dihydro-6-hydroxymethylpterin-pyrophosphokinase